MRRSSAAMARVHSGGTPRAVPALHQQGRARPSSTVPTAESVHKMDPLIRSVPSPVSVESAMSRQVQIAVLALIGAGALLGTVLIAAGTVGGGGISLRSTSKAGAAPAVAGASAPPRVQDSVAAWTKKYGEPDGATFARLRIPSIGVNAPVGAWAVKGTVMPEPHGPVDVAWYDLSAFPGQGGYPGGGKNAVFGAHADLNRDIAGVGRRYTGPAVFWNLDQLRPGDRVEVDINGQTLKYSVVWSREVDAETADWGPHWSSAVKVDSITLYTCGGKFNPDTHEYSTRLVVRAERVK